MTEPPLVVGRLVGLRAWDLEPGGRLKSPYRSMTWPRRRHLTARCDQGHDAPSRRCGCGLYGLHPTRAGLEVLGPAARHASVLGLIEAWGDVEVHECGFRAQYARPVALAVPPGAPAAQQARIRAAAERYGLELLPHTDASGLARLCRSRRWGLDEPAVAGLLKPVAPDVCASPQPLPRPPTLVRRAAARVAPAAAVAGVLGGLLAGLWVLGLLLGLVGRWLEGPPPPPRLAAERDLRVVAQQTIECCDGDYAHVALVRNEHPTLSAIGVWGTAGALDRRSEQDHRPSLAPGQTGLLVDVVEYDEGLPRRLRVRARRFVAGATAPPVDVDRVRIDRRRCIATARVWSRRPMKELGVWLLYVNRRDRLIDIDVTFVGPLRGGRNDQVLERVDPGRCVNRRHVLYAHAVAPRRLLTDARAQPRT